MSPISHPPSILCSSNSHIEEFPAGLYLPEPSIEPLVAEGTLRREVSAPAPTPSPSFGLSDLALLHHWTVSTCRSIISSSPADYCWQVVYPQIGSRHPFVMHSILSLAALHLAHTDRDSAANHALDASRHHNEGLKGFREAMDNMSKDNTDALFACSTLNIVYVFGTLRWPCDDVDARHSCGSYTSRILGTEWIPLTRGVQAVMRPVIGHARLGPLGKLLDVGNWGELNPDRNPVAQDHRFRDIREAWAGSEDAQTFDDALYILRKCYMYHVHFNIMKPEPPAEWGWNREWAGPLRFLYFAPGTYFLRLHQRQPPALLMFAYLGVILHASNHYWFMEGWGRDIVKVIDGMLGEYWSRWMAWPLEAVGLT